MVKHTPYSPGDPIRSSYTNDDIDGLSTGANDTDNNSLQLFRKEAFDNFVGIGLDWSIISGLNASMTSGAVYINGERVAVNAIGNKAFTDNKDVYVNVYKTGTVTYQEVEPYATAPAVPTDSIRIAVIYTSGGSISDVQQEGTDGNGVPIRNTSPVIGNSSIKIQSVSSSSSIYPSIATTEMLVVTALAANTTIQTPTGGSASDGQPLLIRIKDNGTSRTISWGSQYRAIGVTLPTSTTASRTLYVMARYNAVDNFWDVLSVGRGA